METSLPEAVVEKLFGGETPSRACYAEALDELQARWDTIERAQFESWGQLGQMPHVGRHWWVRGTGCATITENSFTGKNLFIHAVRMTATHHRSEDRTDGVATMAKTVPMRKVRTPEGLTYLDRTFYENNRLSRGTAIRGEKRFVLIWELTPGELSKENEAMSLMHRELLKIKRGAKPPKPNRYSLTIQSFDIATGYPAAERWIKGYDDTPKLWSQSAYIAVDWDEAGYRAALGDE